MKKNNKKIMILITVIILIGIIIGSILIRRFVVNQETKNEKYLIGENKNSNLIANNIKKGVTIGGITGTLESLDTSDANAAPEDIVANKTAYVKGSKITGTLVPLNTSDATATAQDILTGKTAYVNGNKITGTLSPGSKVATGTVMSLSRPVDVNCGFRITAVMLYSYDSQIIYNNGQGYAMYVSERESGYDSMEESSYFIEPLANGFRLTSDTESNHPCIPTGTTYTYVAIG